MEVAAASKGSLSVTELWLIGAQKNPLFHQVH